ncbi:MAG: J domain-containing protein [Coriobacteriales bacterium]|nr:J domain-containing protein [Coriobacteriales bacterium]
MRQEMTKEAAEELLELPHRYTKEDLRQAYTKLARKYHPDAAARHHYDQSAAQAMMVDANKANDVLKQQFANNPERVVERGWGSVSSGYSGVDWRSVDKQDTDDPWSFVEDWSVEAPDEEVPLSVRSILLGPVVLRVLFCALFALLWWNTFPLLPHNLASVPETWTLASGARVLAALIYPTYLLIFELLSGQLSCLVREVANGAVSWFTRSYVDLRSKSANQGCALYKILRNQLYALLMVPLVLYLASCAFNEQGMLRIALGILTLALGVDMLAAFVRGGFVNTLTASLAERVEDSYLTARVELLKRCGKWNY